MMIHTKGNNRPNRPARPNDESEEPAPTFAHGRYAGQQVEAVPEIDLRWLLTFDIEGSELRAAIRKHLSEGQR